MLEVYDRFWRLVGVYESIPDCTVATGLTEQEIRMSVLDGVPVRGQMVLISKSLLWAVLRREISNRQDKLGAKEISVLENVSVGLVRTVIRRARKQMRRRLVAAGVKP